MNKTITIKHLLVLLFTAFSAVAMAQPGNIEGDFMNGSWNNTQSLTDLGSFRQYRGLSSFTGNGNYLFNPAPANYSAQWTGSNSPNFVRSINTFHNGGAFYYTSGGWNVNLQSAFTSGRYYTFNTQENSASNNTFALLETQFNPRTASIAANSQVPLASGVTATITPEVTVDLSGPLQSGEYLYIRYTTNAFTSSSVLELTSANLVRGTTTKYRGYLPAQTAGTTVQYYAMTSNQASVALATLVGANGQTTYDMFTLALANNAGSPYSYTTIATSANPVIVSSTGGTTYQNYATISAANTALNAGTHTGTVNVVITGNTTEPATIVGLANSAVWTSMRIIPQGNVSVTSNNAASTAITFTGGDNVTYDGINNGTSSLTIANTNTGSGTSTILFNGGSTNNTLINCNVQGSGLTAINANGGTIYFATDANTANGNDNNTITYCNIGPAGVNLPSKAIYGNGSTTTTAIGNSGININNNNIFDFFLPGGSHAGIYTQGGCNTWTVNNNRMYQTATRTATAALTHSIISFQGTAAVQGAQGHTITNNILGFATNTGTGTYTLAGGATAMKFCGIQLNGIAAGTSSDISSNTIANISVTGVSTGGTTTSSPFSGIMISSGVATINNNIIGSQSATGSLVFTMTSASTSDVHGIINFGLDNTTISNNQIGGMTMSSGSSTFVVYGIRVNTGSALTLTATNNTIGGTIANSIQIAVGTGTSNQVIGFAAQNPISTLTSNTIRNLSNIGGTGTSTSASVIGILQNGTGANHTLSQNQIYSLTNTNTTAATTITGIQYNASTGANTVERNLIYGLTSSTTSTTAEINGIRVAGGTTTYRNNFIALGAGVANSIGAAATNSATAGINGINEALGTDNFYHNTVYIGGTATAGVGASFAFNGTQTTNTRSFRNNIFVNARNNSGATGKHYAVKINGTVAPVAGLTINNNIYYAPNAGGTLGFFNSLDVTTLGNWKTVVGQDANSYNVNPQLNDPTNAIPDLHIHPTNPSVAEGLGATGLGVTNDFDGQTRSGLTPEDIGADAGNFVAAPVMSYSSSTVTQTNTTSVFTNTTNQQVVGLQIVTTGAISPLSLTSLDFNITGTTASADIANAKIWYTGTSATFATTTQFATTVASPTGTHTVTGTTELAEGTNHFWLTYDVVCGATNANVIDGQITTITVGAAQTPTVTNPSGSRTIATGPLSGTYTVGTAGTYATLTAAVGDITSRGLGGNTTFSMVSSTTEPAGVVINNWVECGGSNFTLTIKPAAATTPTITASSATATILINAASRVTIDGSNNGTNTRDMTIANTNTGTASAVVWGRNGSSNNTIKNLIITGNSNTTTFVGAGFGGSTISLTDVSTAANNSNTIQNNDIRAVQYGIMSNGVSTATRNTGTVITGNILNNTSTNALGKGGIIVKFDNGAQVSSNTIGNISSSSTVFGINLGATAFNSYTPGTADAVINATISKNNISALTSTSTASCIGILVSTAATGTTQISNNAVAQINGGSTPSDITCGIFVGGGASSTNVWFNSVYMNGGSTLSRTTPNIALYIGNTTNNPIVNVRNNVLQNIATSSSALTAANRSYAFVSTSTPSYSNLVFNNNSLFVSGTHGVISGTGATLTTLTAANTLGDLTTALTTGGASPTGNISSDPLFNSTTNLIPQPSSPIENVADATTGITDDLNSVSRDGTPHMGAYEVSNDLTGPIITYTPLVNDCVTGARTLTATITDLSAVPTSGAGLPVAYFKIGAGAYTAVTGTFVSGNTYTFSIGTGSTFNDVVSYYVVAQDAYGTPNASAFPSAGAAGFSINPPAVSTAPTTPSTYTVLPILNGNYNVGAGQPYTTLTAAVASYNSACISGAVTFTLMDATYAAETYPITINSNASASATNTLTIKPNTGVTPSFTGSTATALIVLNGADYVTINGSNGAIVNSVCPTTAATRDMTFNNTNTGTSSAVIWIQTATGSNGATNNTIRNCNVVGNSNTTTLVGIGSGSSTISMTSLGTGNNNNSYINNNISKSVNGIYSSGASAGSKNSGTVINQNLINSTSPNNVALAGIVCGFDNNVTISGNNVANLVSASTTDAVAISVGYSFNGMSTTSFGTNEVTNAVISNNKINSITAANTYSAVGIALGVAASGTSTINNNAISIINSNGTGGDFGAGIFVNNATGSTVNVYHNSVSMTGGTTATLTTTGGNYALALGGTTSGTIDIRNNILFNTTTTNMNGYCFGTSLSTFTGITLNNNDYYKPAAGNFVLARTGSLASGANVTATPILAGQDANSVTVLPTFISTSDLHLVTTDAVNMASLNAGGAAVSITTDMDCVTRHLTTPDIGADEFVLANTASWIGGISSIWSNASNWDANVIPTTPTDVTILNIAPNMPVMDISGATKNIAFGGAAARLSINGQTLTINGAVSGSGLFVGSNTSKLVLASTSAVGTISFDQTTSADVAVVNGTNALQNLEVTGTGGSVTLGNRVNLFDKLNVSAGTLNTGGNLVLRSTATNTSFVAPVGGTINGQAVVERYYHKNFRGWRMVTAPVTYEGIADGTIDNVFNNWQNNFGYTGNYGCKFSANVVPTGANGLDAKTNGANLLRYNSVGAGGWTSITNTKTEMISGSTASAANNGYFLFVRGDRTVDPSVTQTPNSWVQTTLAAKGKLQTGAQVFTYGGSANVSWIVGNPYAAPVDMSAVTYHADIPNGVYVWDPNLTGVTTSSPGAYTVFDRTNWAAGPVAGAMTKYFQSGQAFLVKPTATAATISFAESNKSTSANNNTNTTGTINGLVDLFNIKLYAVQPDATRTNVDGLRAKFGDYNNAIDADDISKVNNAIESISLTRGASNLAVEARANIVNDDSLFVKMANMVVGSNYEFIVNPINFDASVSSCKIIDNFLNTETALSLTSNTTVPFTITSVAGSNAANRFTIVFKGSNPLPIRKLVATAAKKDNGVQVNFTATEEKDMATYQVQKSSDARNYNSIKEVAAQNTAVAEYTAMDNNPSAVNYYRIKAISNNGTIQYSNVVKVDMNSKTTNGVKVYPNPVVSNDINIQLTGVAEGLATLRVFNTAGQLVITQTFNNSATNSTINIELAKTLATGTYNLQVTDAKGNNFNEKLVKAK